MVRAINRWRRTAAVVSLCLVCAFCACHGGNGAARAGRQHSAEVVADGDSVVYHLSEPSLECHIRAVVPDSGLQTVVGEWLDEQLGGCYEGNPADMAALVAFCGKSATDSLRQSAAEAGEGTIVELQATMEKAYETSQVVTYTLSVYQGLGGAHPSTEELGATFRKSDGRRLTWDIIRRPLLNDFNSLVCKSLCNYFGVTTEEELESNLMGVDNVYALPLPKTQPIWLDNGVALVYQQYEIASYASGMPTDTISYQRMEPYLTGWAKRLVK